MQFLCIAVFALQFAQAWDAATRVSFMSLDVDAGECEPVKISFQQKWELDDSGYWSSSPRWGFAASMLAISTRSFETTKANWRATDAVGMFNTFANFNTELEQLGSGHAAVRMVVMDMPVRNSWDGTESQGKQKGVPLTELKFNYGSPSMTAQIIVSSRDCCDQSIDGLMD